MANLSEYLHDGASHQAKAVLAFLQIMTIESSWDEERKKYLAEPEVARWENCREQGYVVSMRSKDYSRQINIAFFEHRNSDNICAVKWEQRTVNSPTIETAEFGDVYKDKWDTSYTVNHGEIVKMSDWIIEELTMFWDETAKTTNNK